MCRWVRRAQLNRQRQRQQRQWWPQQHLLRFQSLRGWPQQGQPSPSQCRPAHQLLLLGLWMPKQQVRLLLLLLLLLHLVAVALWETAWIVLAPAQDSPAPRLPRRWRVGRGRAPQLLQPWLRQQQQGVVVTWRAVRRCW